MNTIVGSILIITGLCVIAWVLIANLCKFADRSIDQLGPTTQPGQSPAPDLSPCDFADPMFDYNATLHTQAHIIPRDFISPADRLNLPNDNPAA